MFCIPVGYWWFVEMEIIPWWEASGMQRWRHPWALFVEGGGTAAWALAVPSRFIWMNSETFFFFCAHKEPWKAGRCALNAANLLLSRDNPERRQRTGAVGAQLATVWKVGWRPLRAPKLSSHFSLSTIRCCHRLRFAVRADVESALWQHPEPPKWWMSCSRLALVFLSQAHGE